MSAPKSLEATSEQFFRPHFAISTSSNCSSSGCRLIPISSDVIFSTFLPDCIDVVAFADIFRFMFIVASIRTPRSHKYNTNLAAILLHHLSFSVYYKIGFCPLSLRFQKLLDVQNIIMTTQLSNDMRFRAPIHAWAYGFFVLK